MCRWLLLPLLVRRAWAMRAVLPGRYSRLETFEPAALTRSGGTEAERFCEAMRRDHAAVVELPLCHHPAIADMWSYASEFYELPTEVRKAMGPLGEPEFSDDHLGQPRLFGFTQMSFNECLDTRLRRPSSNADTMNEIELLPRGFEVSIPGSTPAMVKAQDILFSLGTSVLHTIIDSLTENPLSPLSLTPEGICCSSKALTKGTTCATIHRFVRYAPDGDLKGPQRVREASSQSSAADGDDVLNIGGDFCFPTHTDGTWLTLVPCAAQSGLEVRAAFGWVRPEDHARHGTDVIVLSGEFLSSLSKREYLAAAHRVVRPNAGECARLSAPLLMRAGPKYRELCKQADERRRTRSQPQAKQTRDIMPI